MGRKFEAVILKFLTGIDGAENLAPDLLRRLHFASDLVCPFVRHMAVRATRAYARPVIVVHRRLELLEHIGMHLVTRGAERLGVGELKPGIESTPEDDPGDEAGEHQKPQAEYRAWPGQDPPDLKREQQHAPPERRPRNVSRRHRRPPGSGPFRRESMSAKSFSTGVRTLCWGT